MQINNLSNNELSFHVTNLCPACSTADGAACYPFATIDVYDKMKRGPWKPAEHVVFKSRGREGNDGEDSDVYDSCVFTF